MGFGVSNGSKVDHDMAVLRDSTKAMYVKNLRTLCCEIEADSAQKNVLGNFMVNWLYNTIPLLEKTKVRRAVIEFKLPHHLGVTELYFVGWYDSE